MDSSREQASRSWYATGCAFTSNSGTTNIGTYTITFSTASGGPAAPASIVDGLVVCFKASADNSATAANFQLQITGVGGAIDIKKNKNQNIVKGDILSGQFVTARYDGSVWQMQGPTELPDSFKGTIASVGAAFTGTFAPPFGQTTIASYTEIEGRPFYCVLANTNVGSDTFNPTIGSTALGAKTIKKLGSTVLAPGDMLQTQEVILIYNAPSDAWQLMNPVANAVVNVGVIADSRNLIMRNNTASPDTVIDVIADEVIVKKPADGSPAVLRGVSFTIDITAPTGTPGGRDSGVARSTNTWYYVYVIYNGSTISGVLASSPTTPTLTGSLSTFSYWAMVGAYRTDGVGSGNLRRAYTTQRRCIIARQQLFSGKAAAVANTYEILAADLATFQGIIPTLIVKTALGVMGSSTSGSSTQLAIAACTDAPAVSADNLGEVINNGISSTQLFPNTLSFYGAVNFEIPIRGGNFQWQCQDVVARNKIDFTGYTF